jgi:hypothetical protein
MLGVAEVTSNKCPSERRPKLFPLANKVDATKSALLLALKITAEAEYKVLERDVVSE